MSLGDIPSLPDKDIKRLEILLNKIKNGELSFVEFLEQASLSIGVVKINETGLEIVGKFKLERRQYLALIETLNKAAKLNEVFYGKTIFIKITGIVNLKIKIRRIPKIKILLDDEIKKTDLPRIEIDRDVIILMFKGIEGHSCIVPEALIKIYGLEIISDWFGEGWEMNSALLNVMSSMSPLYIKENLVKMRDSYIQYWNDVLNKCGV